MALEDRENISSKRKKCRVQKIETCQLLLNLLKMSCIKFRLDVLLRSRGINLKKNFFGNHGVVILSLEWPKTDFSESRVVTLS